MKTGHLEPSEFEIDSQKIDGHTDGKVVQMNKHKYVFKKKKDF